MIPTNEYKVPDFPFTDDQFHRTMANLHIVVSRICRKSSNIDEEEKRSLYTASNEAMNMAYMLHQRFFAQYNHNPSARRVCPNPECHHIYAFFYDDWKYCPQCGSRLIKTMYDWDRNEYVEEEA